MTFRDRYRQVLYARVPIHHGVRQWHPDLRHVRDDDLNVYSDILLHLPVLEWFSSLGRHSTEFGVRNVVSTLAILSGAGKNGGKVVSYDIHKTPAVDEVLGLKDLPCPWEFHEQDTLAAEIEETDFLFIDTLHTGDHVHAELSRHWGKVKRFVAFHDTAEDGAFACPPHNYLEGILEFLAGRHDYRTAYRTELCNGLWVLEKI